MVTSNESFGLPKIDPTLNTKELMSAALDALGQLRLADKELNNNNFDHIKEVASLRADHLTLLRSSDLKVSEKTREVDVQASTASAAALAANVSALQAATDRNAETLRKQVADTAIATQSQTDNLFRRVDDRVAALERSVATGAGRSAVVDPQLTELVSVVQKLISKQDTAGGVQKGISASFAVGVAVATLLLSLLGVLVLDTTQHPLSPVVTVPTGYELIPSPSKP